MHAITVLKSKIYSFECKFLRVPNHWPHSDHNHWPTSDSLALAVAPRAPAVGAAASPPCHCQCHPQEGHIHPLLHQQSAAFDICASTWAEIPRFLQISAAGILISVSPFQFRFYIPCSNKPLGLFHRTSLSLSTPSLISLLHRGKQLESKSFHFYCHKRFFLRWACHPSAPSSLQLAISMFFNKGTAPVPITKHSSKDNDVFLLPFLTWGEGEHVNQMFWAKKANS